MMTFYTILFLYYSWKFSRTPNINRSGSNPIDPQFHIDKVTCIHLDISISGTATFLGSIVSDWRVFI